MHRCYHALLIGLALCSLAGISRASDSADAAPLAFSELFVLPVGPKGLEYTARLRDLDGQRVRLTGFMVRETNVDPGLFLFAGVPITTYACESLASAELPPQVVQVMLAPRPGFGAAWQPRRLEVTGRLELGPREERDGRVSYVRVYAEEVISADTREPVDVQIPVVRRALGDPGPR